MSSNQLQAELVDIVRTGMADRGWSQDELARRSGVRQPSISLMVNGLRDGTLDTWNKLLRALEDA